MTNKEFTCTICGLPVEDSDLRKYEDQIGHDTCIKNYIKSKGLNESTTQPKKTSFLLG